MFEKATAIENSTSTQNGIHYLYQQTALQKRKSLNKGQFLPTAEALINNPSSQNWVKEKFEKYTQTHYQNNYTKRPESLWSPEAVAIASALVECNYLSGVKDGGAHTYHLLNTTTTPPSRNPIYLAATEFLADICAWSAKQTVAQRTVECFSSAPWNTTSTSPPIPVSLVVPSLWVPPFVDQIVNSPDRKPSIFHARIPFSIPVKKTPKDALDKYKQNSKIPGLLWTFAALGRVYPVDIAQAPQNSTMTALFPRSEFVLTIPDLDRTIAASDFQWIGTNSEYPHRYQHYTSGQRDLVKDMWIDKRAVKETEATKHDYFYSPVPLLGKVTFQSAAGGMQPSSSFVVSLFISTASQTTNAPEKKPFWEMYRNWELNA